MSVLVTLCERACACVRASACMLRASDKGALVEGTYRLVGERVYPGHKGRGYLRGVRKGGE